jgi:hypothetical protein
MQTVDVRKFRFELHKGVLHIRRTKHGSVEKWKPKTSGLPPFIFSNVHEQVSKRWAALKRKNYETVREAILQGLVEAGEICHFKVKRNSSRGDLVWLCNEHRFVVFLICDRTEHPGFRKDVELLDGLRHDDTDIGHRFRKMERESPALLRIAWNVGKGGFARMLPAKLRESAHG